MVVIAKIFGTYVSLGNLGLSMGKIHRSPRKLHFYWGTFFIPYTQVVFGGTLFVP
jgi:hypothetical protein